jgi:predicted RNase H-like HicB family nuclease
VSDVGPIRLVVRCLLEQKGDQWQAFSLEFGLAAQGDSEQEVRQKLESMIEWYVRDALIGEDREHAYDLLIRRKARWPIFLRYYLAWTVSHIVMLGSKFGKVYREALPLDPRHCTA